MGGGGRGEGTAAMRMMQRGTQTLACSSSGGREWCVLGGRQRISGKGREQMGISSFDKEVGKEGGRRGTALPQEAGRCG